MSRDTTKIPSTSSAEGIICMHLLQAQLKSYMGATYNDQSLAEYILVMLSYDTDRTQVADKLTEFLGADDSTSMSNWIFDNLDALIERSNASVRKEPSSRILDRHHNDTTAKSDRYNDKHRQRDKTRSRSRSRSRTPPRGRSRHRNPRYTSHRYTDSPYRRRYQTHNGHHSREDRYYNRDGGGRGEDDRAARYHHHQERDGYTQQQRGSRERSRNESPIKSTRREENSHRDNDRHTLPEEDAYTTTRETRDEQWSQYCTNTGAANVPRTSSHGGRREDHHHHQQQQLDDSSRLERNYHRYEDYSRRHHHYSSNDHNHAAYERNDTRAGSREQGRGWGGRNDHWQPQIEEGYQYNDDDYNYNNHRHDSTRFEEAEPIHIVGNIQEEEYQPTYTEEDLRNVVITVPNNNTNNNYNNKPTSTSTTTSGRHQQQQPNQQQKDKPLRSSTFNGGIHSPIPNKKQYSGDPEKQKLQAEMAAKIRKLERELAGLKRITNPSQQQPQEEQQPPQQQQQQLPIFNNNTMDPVLAMQQQTMQFQQQQPPPFPTNIVFMQPPPHFHNNNNNNPLLPSLPLPQLPIPQQQQQPLVFDRDACTILVHGITQPVTQQILTAHFSVCGLVTKITFLRNPVTKERSHLAWVEFAVEVQAIQALALDNSPLLQQIIRVWRKGSKEATAAVAKLNNRSSGGGGIGGSVSSPAGLIPVGLGPLGPLGPVPGIGLVRSMDYRRNSGGSNSGGGGSGGSRSKSGGVGVNGALRNFTYVRTVQGGGRGSNGVGDAVMVDFKEGGSE